MADNFPVRDGDLASRTLRTTENAGTHTPHHVAASLVGGVPTPVSSTKPMPVSLPDIVFDMFGRVRTSDPGFRFDSQFTYQVDADLWDSSVSGGSVTHSATNRLATLTANASGTNTAIIQSHYFAPYTPGRSQLAFITFTLGATPGTGAYRRVGYFDGVNGVYLEHTASGLTLRIITGTGAGNDSVAQASWNFDPMDGTGPSGITLDPTKAQILVVGLQALYNGAVGVGFDIGGKIIPVHVFAHANVEAYPYIQYASLPVRYEVGTTSAAVSMDAICASVISEGGEPLSDVSGRTFSASNGTTTIGVTTRRPVLSIRAKQQLNSINNVGLLAPIECSALVTTNNAYVELVRNGTLTGASFASVSTLSLAESDVAATAISGGQVVASFNIPASAQTRAQADKGLLGKLLLSYSHLLSTADTLSVVATSHTGTANVSAGIGWKEIR